MQPSSTSKLISHLRPFFKYILPQIFQFNCSKLIFVGVGGSTVAVLALAVLYECAKGLHVYLRSRLRHHKKKTTNRIYYENTR